MAGNGIIPPARPAATGGRITMGGDHAQSCQSTRRTFARRQISDVASRHIIFQGRVEFFWTSLVQLQTRFVWPAM